MNPIPMSTFIDFCTTSGTPRVTLVRTWKREETEVNDFYAGFKSAIVGMHAKGLTVDSLRAFLSGQRDARRKRIYPELAQHYGEWLKRLPATITTSGAPARFAKSRPTPASFGVSAKFPGVRVDPLLTMSVGPQVYLVKLYLRDAKPDAQRISITLELMRAAYDEPGSPVFTRGVVRYAVLDVRRKKLHVSGAVVGDVEKRSRILLYGELAAFNAIYWRA